MSRYPTFSFAIVGKAESDIDDVDVPDQLISLGFEDMSILTRFIPVVAGSVLTLVRHTV